MQKKKWYTDKCEIEGSQEKVLGPDRGGQEFWPMDHNGL